MGLDGIMGVCLCADGSGSVRAVAVVFGLGVRCRCEETIEVTHTQEPAGASSNPSSTAPVLCDLGHITWPLCAPVPHKLQLIITPTSKGCWEVFEFIHAKCSERQGPYVSTTYGLAVITVCRMVCVGLRLPR